MSKHLGNILEPIPLMEQHGADALRWFMAARRVAVAQPPGRPRRAAGDRPQDAADLLEHRVVPHALRRRRRLVAAEQAAPEVAERPVLDRWLLSELHRLVPEVTAALESFDTPRAGRRLADVRRRPVQLVRPPVPAPVLGGRPGGAGDAARVPARRDAAAGAVRAVRHRAGLAGRRPPGVAGGARLGAPGRLAGGRRRAGRRRAGRADGAGPPARRARPGGRAAAEGAQPAAAGPGAGRRHPAGPSCPTSCARRSPTSSTCTAFDELDAGELVDVSAKGNFRALGKRFGKRTPAVAAAVAAADAGGAGGRAAGRRPGDRRWSTARTSR